jgi:hypothetical protein
LFLFIGLSENCRDGRFFHLPLLRGRPKYRFTEGGNAGRDGTAAVMVGVLETFWEWMTGRGVELAPVPRFCFPCFLTLMDI